VIVSKWLIQTTWSSGCSRKSTPGSLTVQLGAPVLAAPSLGDLAAEVARHQLRAA